MRFIFLLVILTSCITPDDETYRQESNCGPVTTLGQALETYRDFAALERAKNRCVEMFPASPCLHYFTKIEDGIYEAICNSPREPRADSIRVFNAH